MSRSDTATPAGAGAINAGERTRLMARGLTRYDVVEDLKTVIARAGNSRSNAAQLLGYAHVTISNMLGGHNPIGDEILEKLYGAGARNKLQLTQIFADIAPEQLEQWRRNASESEPGARNLSAETGQTLSATTDRAVTPPAAAPIVEAPAATLPPSLPGITAVPSWVGARTADQGDANDLAPIAPVDGNAFDPQVAAALDQVDRPQPVSVSVGGLAAAVAQRDSLYVELTRATFPIDNIVAMIAARRDQVAAALELAREAVEQGTAELAKLDAALPPLQDLAA